MFTAHDRAGDRPGNEATLRAFRARKQRWRAASFPFNDRCVFIVYVQNWECVCGNEAMKGLIFLTPLLCHFSEERGRISPNVWAKCAVRPLSQIPDDSGFKSKYLLELKRKQAIE